MSRIGIDELTEACGRLNSAMSERGGGAEARGEAIYEATDIWLRDLGIDPDDFHRVAKTYAEVFEFLLPVDPFGALAACYATAFAHGWIACQLFGTQAAEIPDAPPES